MISLILFPYSLIDWLIVLAASGIFYFVVVRAFALPTWLYAPLNLFFSLTVWGIVLDSLDVEVFAAVMITAIILFRMLYLLERTYARLPRKVVTEGCISKYPVEQFSAPRWEVEMPSGAQLFKVGAQDAGVFLWALVNPKAPLVHRTLAMAETGTSPPSNGRYIGTFEVADEPSGTYVGHVFDLGEMA